MGSAERPEGRDGDMASRILATSSLIRDSARLRTKNHIIGFPVAFDDLVWVTSSFDSVRVRIFM